MFKKVLQHCRKPQGFLGRFFLAGMNAGHAPTLRWGLSRITPPSDARALDIGCGGGAAVAALLALCPQGIVHGIDYSEASVAASRRKNAALLGERCEIALGSVSALPYPGEIFDLVTAFETVYFWPALPADFREVHRVLKPGGCFCICNELNDPGDDTWTKRIEGMTVYSRDDIAVLLVEAGFRVVVNDKDCKGRVCLVGEK